MKTVLITGASGFVGNYVINELLKLDKYLIVAAGRKYGKTAPSNKKVLYKHFDLNQGNDNWFKYLGSPDILIHLAWGNLPNYLDLVHFEKELPLHVKFLSNIIQNGLTDLTVSGSCLEYGLSNGCLHENISTMPVTSYGLAKDSLRKYLQLLQGHYQFSLKWLRLFYTSTEGNNPNSLISNLYSSLKNGDSQFNMSEGEQLRDFLPMELIARYIVMSALQKEINGIINICSGTPISVRRLVEEKICESKQEIKLNLGYYPYLNYEPMAFWGDREKLDLINKKT